MLLIILGLKKALKTASSLDKTGLITEWTTSIVNHLYWCAASTEEGQHSKDIILDKWKSLLNHICNKHTHAFEHYKKCEHPRRKKGERKKKYFKRGM